MSNQNQGDQLLHIPLDNINLPDFMLRKVDTHSLEFLQLKDDINLNGLIQPIRVRALTDAPTSQTNTTANSTKGENGTNSANGTKVNYIIESGCNRYLAIRELGWPTVPSILSEAQGTEAQKLFRSISENLHRKEMTLSEYRAAIRFIIKEHPEYTSTDIARRLSKGTDWVQKIMGIQNITPQVSTLVNEGRLTLDKAFALAKFNNDPEKQINYAFQVLDMNNKEAIEYLTHEHQLITQSQREAGRVREVTLTDKPIQRKWPEVEKLLLDPTTLGATLLKHNITDPSVIKAAQWALKFAFSLDPVTVAKRRKEHEDKINKKQNLLNQISDERKRIHEEDKNANSNSNNINKNEEISIEL